MRTGPSVQLVKNESELEMKVTTALHCIVGALELLVLVSIVLWFGFDQSICHPSERTFSRPGDRLCVTFGDGQGEMLHGIRRCKVYFMMKGNGKFDQYYRAKSRSDALLKEEDSVEIAFNGEGLERSFEVELPVGDFDFRLDFYVDKTAVSHCSPPRIEKATFGERLINGDHLHEFMNVFEHLNCYGFRYVYKPMLHGFMPEYVVSVLIMWIVLVCCWCFFVFKNGRRVE